MYLITCKALKTGFGVKVFERRLETISRSEEADLHLNRLFLQKGSLPGVNRCVRMSFERMLIVPWFKELFEIPVMQLC